MKKVKLNLSKLALKKEVITNLTINESNQIIGGATLVDGNCGSNNCSAFCQVTVPYTSGGGTFNSYANCWSAPAGCR
jgi:hypothetical protein